MQQLKQIWHTFVASLTNPTLYSEIINAQAAKVWGYFLAATTGMALLTAAWLYFLVVPEFIKNSALVKTELLASIPADRVITTDSTGLTLWESDAQGQLATASTPLLIASPPSLPKLFGLKGNQVQSFQKAWPDQLVIITPTKVSAPESFLASLETTTLVVVDPQNLFLFDGDSWETNPLKFTNQSPETLDSTTVTSGIEAGYAMLLAAKNKYQIWLYVLVVVGSILGAILTAFWQALLVLLISKVFSYALTYHQAFKLTTYILIVAQAINLVAIFVMPWSSVDMLSLSFWVITLYLFYQLRDHLPKKTSALPDQV